MTISSKRWRDSREIIDWCMAATGVLAAVLMLVVVTG